MTVTMRRETPDECRRKEIRVIDEMKACEEVFIPLADYKEPAMPAQELLRTLIGRVQALLVRRDPKGVGLPTRCQVLGGAADEIFEG
jgi:hypothetical protein